MDIEEQLDAIQNPPSGRAILDQIGEEVRNNYNFAPTQRTVIVQQDGDDWVARMMRWMIIGKKVTHPNTRADSLAKWPEFFDGFDRVLVPISGYYEWPTINGRERPVLFRPAGTEKHWWCAGVSKEHDLNGKRVRSFNIVITEPSKDLAELHDTMPVLLPPETHELWLDPLASREDLLSILKPLPEGAAEVFPVSLAVNNARNQGPELVRPLNW